VVEVGTTFFVYREVKQRVARLPKHADSDAPVTHSQLLEGIYEDLRAVADSNLSVLITGKTGTGKEVAAAFLHRQSSRRGPFYPVNCAAIPATVSESFLFGHKKGAFSNAISDHDGVIRAAEGGTLFLDEIAELDLLVQAKLLRVLQEGSVTPIGGTRAIPVDVRFVCATHANLEELVSQGRFRQDLLARLAGHQAELPSLAERREDLGLLTTELLLRRAQSQTKQIIFDRAAMRSMYAYVWPNNVRELDQALHKCALRTNLVVTAEHLPSGLREAEFAVERESVPPQSDGVSLEALTALLEEHHGNVSQIARAVGKARVQIRRWCRRHNLDPASFREAK
jgi:DNA-binding NtrC family response regulator